MSKGFVTTNAALLAAVMLPSPALAANCVPQVSAEQQAFLDQQNLEMKVPQGELAVVQRCDTNEDNVVDLNDIRKISLARNQPARYQDDPMDWDRGDVTALEYTYSSMQRVAGNL